MVNDASHQGSQSLYLSPSKYIGVVNDFILRIRHDEMDVPRPGQRPGERVPARHNALEMVAPVVIAPNATTQVERAAIRRVEPETFEYQPLALVARCRVWHWRPAGSRQMR
jgi:hypothetical protein